MHNTQCPQEVFSLRHALFACCYFLRGSRTKCEYHPTWCYGEGINGKDILDGSTVIRGNKVRLGNNVHYLHVNGVRQYVSQIIPSAAVGA